MADPPTSSSSSTGEGGGERRNPSTAPEGDSKGVPGFSRGRLPARIKEELAAKAQKKQEEEMEKRTATTGNLSTTPQPTAPSLLPVTVARSNTPTPSTTTLPSSTPAISRSRLPPGVRPSPSPAPSIASSSTSTTTSPHKQRLQKSVPVIEIAPRAKSLKPSSLNKERDGSQAGSKSEEVRQSTVTEGGAEIREPTGLGIILGGKAGTLEGQGTEKGKEKDTEEMDVSMELDSASDTITSENGGTNGGGDSVKQSTAAEYVALCFATLKDLDVSKSGDQEELGRRLSKLFGILHRMYLNDNPPPPPPAPTLPSSPSVSLSALEELELRMTARMDKVQKERDGEIESLKTRLAQQEKERISLTSSVKDLTAGLGNAMKMAEEAKREAEEVKKSGRGDSVQQFNAASIDKRIDDKLNLARKPIFEAAAVRAEANMQIAIDRVRTDFDSKVKSIDEGFQDWWSEQQAGLERWWTGKATEWEARLASTPRSLNQLAISARSASSTSSLPMNPPPPADPRRTTALQSHPSLSGSVSPTTTSASSRLPPTGPAASRLTPTGPSSSRLPPTTSTARPSPLSSSTPRPAQSSSAPNLSPRAASPIEPNSTAANTPSATDFVTQQQLQRIRLRQVTELETLQESLKSRMDHQKKDLEGKLAKLGFSRSGDQGVGVDSRGTSPVATRTTSKTARNGGEVENQPAENDDRPSKRPRTEGPSASELTAAIEGAKVDAQVAKEAMQRIGELDIQLKAIKGTVDSERTKVNNIEQKWETDKTEILARMKDGNTSVTRTAQLELKKLSDSSEKSISDLNRKTGGVETELERRISTVENSFSKKLSDAETSLARSISTVDNNLNKKVTELETGLGTKMAAAQQAASKSLSKAERKLEKSISNVESQVNQMENEKNETKKRVEGVEERCAGLTVEISETSDRHRTDQASNQSALNDLRQRIDGKASEEMVQQEISELQRAVSVTKPISPKDILPFVRAELTARHLDDVAHHLLRLQAATDQCQEDLQQVSSKQSHSKQLLDVCHLSLSNLKQESLADNEAFETFQVNANSRFSSLETTSNATITELDQFKADLDRTATSIREQHELDVERITESIRTSKSRSEEDPRLSKLVAEVDRLTRAPSAQDLDSRIQDLRSILNTAQATLTAHQSLLDAIRSKPTPPASPTLASTQSLSTAVTPTSTLSQLSPELKKELLTFVFRSFEELFKRPDSWICAEIAGIRQPLETRMDTWDTRIETLDQTITKKISDVETTSRLNQRLAENSSDMLKDAKMIIDNRFKGMDAYLSTVSHSIKFIHSSLQTILAEAQGIQPQVTPQPQTQSQSQPQSQSQLSSSQNGSYNQTSAQTHAQMQSAQHVAQQQYQQQLGQNPVCQQRSSSLSNSTSRPLSAPNNQSYPNQQSHAPLPTQQQPHNPSSVAALGQYTPYPFNPNFPS